ncbi:nucleoside recognition protein [Halorarum salinum]|uniref:Nucleoside recognition protein n=1 Tax=Halorarum salinum TaxID=2743089 RepID=A0A7D5L961_9EURY|nr:nucleoside recognition protein [Halobaculum salinum]QLG60972.1 nucleoside recognition protein [Halobaculum salinum]
MDAVGLLPLVFDALLRVARIAALVAGGVFLADLAVEFGAVERVAGLSRYLTGPANLPDEAGTAILTTAASTTAGYGMLADFRESGRLSDRATLVAVTVNTFFGFVQHVFTFYAPVLIPILGLQVGVMYVGARAGIALAITLVGVLGGALLLPSSDAGGREGERREPVDEAPPAGGEATDGGTATARERARAAADSSLSTLRRIVPRLAVVYVLVTVLVARVDVESLSAAAGPLAEVAGLPAAAIPVVVIFAFDTTSGAATVAPLVGDALTPEQAVATMLLGGIVSFAVSTFKRSIPFQYGVWGPEFGSKVVLLNTGLKVAFIGVAVAFFLV